MADIVPSAADLTQPPVVNADAGLEATWLVCNADAAGFAAAVTPYLYESLPSPGASVQMWAANGLRLVRVPLKDWATVSSSLRIAGASQRQWLGASGVWTEIVRGPDQPRGQVVALDAERVELGPGRLRLLSRCWMTPVPPDSGPGEGDGGSRAEFVIELVPQLHEQGGTVGGAGMKAFTVAPRAQDPIEQGLVFSRMRLQMRVRNEPNGPYAYVVVSERPGVDWRDAVGERPETDEAPVSEGERPPPAVGEVVRNGSGPARPSAAAVAVPPGAETFGPGAGSSARGAGPQSPLLATLGEALFAVPLPPARVEGEGVPQPTRGARSVLVLIPRTPSAYRLLPPAPVTSAQREAAKP